jgi:hypothetical protein
MTIRAPRLRRILAMCRRCSVLYDSLRKVVIVVAAERTFELPAGYSERLHGLIDQHLLA